MHAAPPYPRKAQRIGCLFAFALTFGAEHAEAGIPECGDMRLEDVSSCEVRGNVECQASCDDLGIYKKACATKLQKVCREECVLDPEPTCTDECTEVCNRDCDIGIPVSSVWTRTLALGRKILRYTSSCWSATIRGWYLLNT